MSNIVFQRMEVRSEVVSLPPIVVTDVLGLPPTDASSMSAFVQSFLHEVRLLGDSTCGGRQSCSIPIFAASAIVILIITRSEPSPSQRSRVDPRRDLSLLLAAMPRMACCWCTGGIDGGSIWAVYGGY